MKINDNVLNKAQGFLYLVEGEWLSQSELDEANQHLCFLRALRKAVEICAPNGYTTWDTSMVPMIDGHYDEAEAKKWELAHGHDIRLKCYPEYGCQLLIDPEDLLTEIAKELQI